MKLKREVELEICDFCKEKEAEYNHCMGCGKAICHDCEDSVAAKYQQGVNVMGSGDGLYCRECDTKLRSDPLHLAYQKIQQLRSEADGYYKSFRSRQDDAENEIKRLLKERGKW